MESMQNRISALHFQITERDDMNKPSTVPFPVTKDSPLWFILLVSGITLVMVAILSFILIIKRPPRSYQAYLNEIPPDMPAIDVQQYGDLIPGKVYFEMASFAPDSQNYILEMNHENGAITFAQQIDGFAMKFERHTSNLLSYYQMTGSNFKTIFNPDAFDGIPFATGGDLVLLDDNYQKLTTISERRGIDLHELLVLDNGNYVFFVPDIRPMYKDPTLTCLPSCQILGQTL